MYKIPWLNFKSCDMQDVNQRLNRSFSMNQLTNYGPLVRELELYFSKQLEVSNDKTVIAVTNATLGMHALVNGINWFNQRKLRYATQAYTFPSSAQGPLHNSQIVDIDREYALDLDQLDSDIDGLVVTNLFGNVCNLNKYITWAKQNNKILLFDNATVPLSYYQDCMHSNNLLELRSNQDRNVVNYGHGCIISLHHTKPLGFGEGGLIIVDKIYEDYVRKCINFGFDVKAGEITWSEYGTNAKMTEIAAASILSYCQMYLDKIYTHHLQLYEKFKKQIEQIEGVQLMPTWSSKTPFVSCFALIYNRKISNDEIVRFELNNIQAKKYYTPLKNLPISKDLFDHILCLPCHLDITEETLDRYVKLISSK